MEPSTPPPKKRRRRRLIVAFVLLLVSLVSWWNWPRGDARFVGKWNSQTQGGSQCVLTFFANGTVISQGPTFSVRGWWRVENGKLTGGFWSEGRLLTIGLWLSNRVGAWTGTYTALIYNEQPIIESAPDRIVLESDVVGDKRTTVLTRLPE